MPAKLPLPGRQAITLVDAAGVEAPRALQPTYDIWYSTPARYAEAVTKRKQHLNLAPA
jgi:hypothetical protein